MTTHGMPLLALALAAVSASPAAAQAAKPTPEQAQDLRRELTEMREQMRRMAERVDSLESQLATASARADAATVAATEAGKSAASATAIARAATAEQPVKVAWKGAPEFSDGQGWSFKPRGRLQLDIGGIDTPKGVPGQSRGLSVESRRAYFGFDGTMPGGFGYRLEADLANSDVQLTDLYLTYAASKNVTVMLGHHKPFFGLDETNSDLFTSMMERAAFSNAFGFERRFGLSATYTGKTLLVQGGIFSDDAAALGDDHDKSWSVDGRVVAMPKLGGGTLHLGASAHLRDLGGTLSSVRYRARPFLHSTDIRFIDTRAMPATGERGIGTEAAWFGGRFYAMGESFWQTVRRPGAPDATFNGGYAEAGYLLTDDEVAYRNGAPDRIKPKTPLGGGGIGAVQVNVRYDWLDLSDAGILGGRQQTAGISLIWMPTSYVRFIANYGHVWLRDAAVSAGGDRNYGVDAAGMRAQFDF